MSDVPVLKGPAEHAFRVHAVSPPGPRVEVLSRSRPWGPAGAEAAPAGVLGVPVDNATGYVVIAAAPPGHWAVTTELSVDLLAPVPVDGRELISTAELVADDGRTAFAEGEVRDDRGTLIARTRQRGQHVPGAPSGPAGDIGACREPDDLAAFLGLAPVETAETAEAGRPDGDSRDGDGGASRSRGSADVLVTQELVNPLGNLHGGVALCLVEQLAVEALAAVRGGRGQPGLRTTAVRVAYLRPVPAGTRVQVEACVVHAGRSLGLVEVTGTLPDGRGALRATVTAGPSV